MRKSLTTLAEIGAKWFIIEFVALKLRIVILFYSVVFAGFSAEALASRITDG